MNFQSVNNLRNKRYGENNMFGPTHFSIANYCTDNRREMPPGFIEDIFTASQHKNEMRNAFGEELLINNLHLIPDPLKKNLADSIITEDNMGKDTREKVAKEPIHEPEDAQTTIAGITSFFSGVFNILSSAMFKRPKSPVNFYDCVDDESREMAPKPWQPAKFEDRDKNGHGNDQSNSNKCYKTNLNGHIPESNVTSEQSDMSDCRAAVAHCEDKLSRVLALLSSKTVPIPTRRRVRRPKRVFVEPGSVEDSFEDAFCPEDFVCLSNDSYVEYSSPAQYCQSELYQTASPVVQTRDGPKQESMDNDLQKKELSSENLQEVSKPDIVEEKTNITMDSTENICKQEIVLSCEDKLKKLKALLLEKCTKNSVSTEIVPEPLHRQPKPTTNAQVNKMKDKRFKNPNRTTSKRKKSKLRKNINEDLIFANEILPDELSSLESSPSTQTPVKPENLLNLTKCNFFDEVRGRFRSDSITDSEDSFQIVVTDQLRLRRPSDCDSEDSFIVFEDTPDCCYTANEVFYESDCESVSSSNSDMSDSGCTMTSLSHCLTRTVSNLADDHLYDEKCHDEVDCVFNGLENVENEDMKKVSLVNEERKKLKKNLPAKKVTFSTEPPKVHVMRVWSFAARQARAGHWEAFARDRDRFKRRIADVDMALSWVLQPRHRARVVFQRFMPWWNAEKRREAAEKLREAAENESRATEHLGEVAENAGSDENTPRDSEKFREVAEIERSDENEPRDTEKLEVVENDRSDENEPRDSEKLRGVAENERGDENELRDVEKFREIAENERSDEEPRDSEKLREVAENQRSDESGFGSENNSSDIEGNGCKVQFVDDSHNVNEIRNNDCTEIIPLNRKFNNFVTKANSKEILKT